MKPKENNWLLDEWVTVRWENPDSERYYLVMIEQDIFGQWILNRIWGGIHKKLGGNQVSVLDNKDQGIEMLKDISIRRKQRGYKRVNTEI